MLSCMRCAARWFMQDVLKQFHNWIANREDALLKLRLGIDDNAIAAEKAAAAKALQEATAQLEAAKAEAAKALAEVCIIM